MTALRRRDSGFSLVELLVVMVVLGILAAIAIPTLLSQRAKAGRSAMLSDLHSIRTAQEARSVDNDPRYTASLAALRSEGYNPSGGVTPARIKLVDGDDQYIACVKHEHVQEWLVFSSEDGKIESSPTDCLA